MAGKQKKGGSAKKHGRNRQWCESYRARGTREKNKRAKMERHLRRIEAKQIRNKRRDNGIIVKMDEQAINAIRSIESKRINALKASAAV